MINTTKTITIKTSKIFEVTLETFVVICQITYKIYAVLQKFNGN
jgi:hypothetical protein